MQSQFQFSLIYTSINNDETASSNITKWLVLAKRQGLQLCRLCKHVKYQNLWQLVGQNMCNYAKKSQVGMSKGKNCRLKCEEGSHLIDMVFIITSCQKCYPFVLYVGGIKIRELYQEITGYCCIIRLNYIQTLTEKTIIKGQNDIKG